MTTTERRQVPRTRLERLAYIDIEPNNGGIVLNASDEGLCFHSIAPVEKNGPVHFSLLAHNRRVDAYGELIWTDERQKVGGLRFSSVSADDRNQIHDWIAQVQTSLEESKNSGLKFAMVSEVRALDGPRFDHGHVENSSPGMTELRSPESRAKLNGFSGGLITGFLVSAFITLIFLSSYTHRRELGRSLIRLGERLTASTEATPPRLLAKDAALASAGTDISTHSQPPALRRENADHTPAVPDAAPDRKPSPAVIDMIHRKPSPVPQASKAPREPEPPSPASVLATSFSPASANLLRSALTTPQLQPASGAPLLAPNSGLTMYFDVGRFKDELSAHNLSTKVGELGFPTTVAKRGHLWANSYQVLVGPYRDQQEERRLESNLVAHGFKPRPFERGSREFLFVSPLVLHTSSLPVGDLVISWESFVSDAKVKFVRAGNLVATADARWMPRAAKYWRDEYVFERNRDGSRTLLEIHFSGLNRALVFRD